MRTIFGPGDIIRIRRYESLNGHELSSRNMELYRMIGKEYVIERLGGKNIHGDQLYYLVDYPWPWSDAWFDLVSSPAWMNEELADLFSL